jgi:NAD(P)-dependent dehydrogenase (short-subunit alcohol dehydrogenase family)
MSLYAGSKHAVEGMTKSAAIEAAAFGVRVNAVAPGPTETGMLDRLAGSHNNRAAFYVAVPMKRGGTPEEIADAIFRQGGVHHRPDHPGERRQDRRLNPKIISSYRLRRSSCLT